jgi:DNA polymerase III epsilon subunit-like protein
VYLFFDTETTGVPRMFGALPAVRQWPRLVQIAWAAYDEAGSCVTAETHLVYPADFAIPASAMRVHGISTAMAKADGKPLGWVIERFLQAVEENGQMLVGHNVAFDRSVVAAEMLRLGYTRESVEKGFYATRHLCLMTATTAFCRLPRRFGKPKYPTLAELHRKLFGEEPPTRHSAVADVEATARCFFRLLERNVIRMKSPSTDQGLRGATVEN